MVMVCAKYDLPMTSINKIRESLGMGGETWLEEWYCVLRWLISWEEPELACYLKTLGFEPE